MSDTYTRPDPIQEKKIGEYNKNLNDFIAAQELTVTITLNEYRALVTKAATAQSQIDQASKDKYTRENENKTLNDIVAKLKAENYELQKRVNELREAMDLEDEEEGPFDD